MTRYIWGKLGIVALIVVPIYYIVGCGFLMEVGGFYPALRNLCQLCLINSATSDNGIGMSPIVPVWYILPSYNMLRAIWFDFGPLNGKLLGLIFAGLAPAMLFTLALYDWTKITLRAWIAFIAVALAIIVAMGVVGAMPATTPFIEVGLALTIAYYALFLIGFPALARRKN